MIREAFAIAALAAAGGFWIVTLAAGTAFYSGMRCIGRLSDAFNGGASA